MDVSAIGSTSKAPTFDEMSSNPHDSVRTRAKEGVFDRLPQKLDKRFGIEGLKALWAMTFAETTNPTSAKKWLSLIEKYFGVMDFPEERKDFKDKFYPRSFCDVKGNKFMSLVQGDTTVEEYEKLFIELAKYALTFVVDERDQASSTRRQAPGVKHQASNNEETSRPVLIILSTLGLIIEEDSKGKIEIKEKETTKAFCHVQMWEFKVTYEHCHNRLISLTDETILKLDLMESKDLEDPSHRERFSL
ncbi:TMV resistance protein N-like [Cucumis melo var. makuwa]|uniref:TMV resistance protein N-like n=1 Tax=Cucumis melo var. makuwa TaxID=1194695 RepID=A0A5D3DGJ4_CUCMM|nr:TMV resistance protein N-like [Cucumis melo var. makuwa]TYK22724.1 TMV resistance protein N-like [Cucumis melo var. makuwa]